jgi:DnaD/phage-associated family protein
MKYKKVRERIVIGMAKYRMVHTEFWMSPIVSEEMTPEDRYFFLYLLTNPHTRQTGIYRITKKQMAFDMGYSIESVNSLMHRFIHHHKLIRYNPETRELAIKNWGKENLLRGGKPVIDCILAELENVEDVSLIQFVGENITKPEFRSLYEFFYKTDDTSSIPSVSVMDDTSDDTCTIRGTIRGQKENEKEKEKEKQQQTVLYPSKVNKPEHALHEEDVKEIIEFWDHNGFGFANLHAKAQLLAWLDDSAFMNPKEVILKAMHIACSNNKRKLSYVVAILKNWLNESLLTIEEIDLYDEGKAQVKEKQMSKSNKASRDIPREFVLDLTAGEKS